VQELTVLVIRTRLMILGSRFLGTISFACQLLHPKIYTSFEDLLPQNHPHRKLYRMFRDFFCRINQGFIVLQVKEGDIFIFKTLKKIKCISEKLEEITVT
jgi:predicted RND superfamily exporter protein